MSARVRRAVSAFAGVSAAVAGLGGCAVAPDRFYTLATRPAAAGAAAAGTASAAHPRVLRLTVTLPAPVDRPQMVLESAAGRILVLEHERWAAAPAELVAGAFARDLERRRPDLAIEESWRSAPRAGAGSIRLDLLEFSARLGHGVRIEARWRIEDAGRIVEQGRLVEAPLANDGYDAVARAFGDALGELADDVAAAVPGP